MADLASLSTGFALGVAFCMGSGAIAAVLAVWAAQNEVLADADHDD